MSFLFWSSAIAMSIMAIAFVAIPLKSDKPLFAAPLTLVALLVPLSAVALYALLGSPTAMTAEAKQSAKEKHAASAPANPQSARSGGSVASLVDGLRSRLENEPNDAGGWLLLARSYQHLGRNDEALTAYAHAQALGKSDQKFEATLLGATLAPPTAIVDPGPALRGRVSLSAEAATRVQPGDTVFIFAKESPDHRMPVVALRKPASDLPIEFVLTEKEMMVPDSKLSDFAELVVTAKISHSGNAADNSSGLEAWSQPVSPQSGETIELIISAAHSGGVDNE